MISGTIAIIITIVELIIFYIAGFHWKVLPEYETVQMIVGYIMFLFTMGYMREQLLGSQLASFDQTAVMGLFLVNWYFFSKLITNAMNKDEAGHIRY